MKSIVIDIDGTICNAINRDYVNAIPEYSVINKINYLHGMGYKITLYSSRGMHSCSGNLSLIVEKNRTILEEWLHKHNVQFDEIIFGKPLGDWYVDDKALTVEDFVSLPFVTLKGGSGESVRREANRVLKTGKSSKMQYDWYNLVSASSSVISRHIPKIHGFTVDTLYMQYISGVNANTCPENILDIIGFIEETAKIQADTHFNLSKYCKNIVSHIDEPWTRDVCDRILSMENLFAEHVSFCHGDSTLANCILTEDNFYMIDPVYKDDFNSYLVDFSKLRMSLNGFEENLNLHTTLLSRAYKESLQKLDSYLEQRKILNLVKLLEIANWIRLHNFREGEEQIFAYNKAKCLWKEYNEE